MLLFPAAGSKLCRYEAPFGRRIAFLCKAKRNEVDAAFPASLVGIRIGQLLNQNVYIKSASTGCTQEKRRAYVRQSISSIDQFELRDLG